MSRSLEEQHGWWWHLVDDTTLRLSAVFTLAFVLMPPEGLGVDLCLSRIFTTAPCPACGMTRCGSNLVRGHWSRALRYHPLGPLVLPVVVALGALALAPRRWRDTVRAALARRAHLLRPIYQVALGGFFLFGILRWLGVVLGVAAFPANWP